MKPAGGRPRREDDPVDASELQEPLLAAVHAPFFATQRSAVEAAGFGAGEGFITFLYDRELPTELLKALMQAPVEDDETTGAG